MSLLFPDEETVCSVDVWPSDGLPELLDGICDELVRFEFIRLEDDLGLDVERSA